MEERLEKLKRFTTASFAVWPFDSEKDFKKIHNRILIIGLNPSAKIKFGENFHKNRFDRWYEEGFSRAPFEGCYMTDLISKHESHSSIIIKKWKNSEFKQKNITSLEEQFKILKILKSTPILCIGKNTEKLLAESFPKFKRILKINHPNSYRIKNKRKIFLKDLKKIGDKIRTKK